MVYEMFVYHLIEDDKKLSDIYTGCRSGDRTCGDCKKECAEKLNSFMKEHQKKQASAAKTAKKIIGDTR